MLQRTPAVVGISHEPALPGAAVHGAVGAAEAHLRLVQAHGAGRNRPYLHVSRLTSHQDRFHFPDAALRYEC